MSIAHNSNAQSIIDTTYTLPVDTITIEDYSKLYLGKANGINDATKKVQKSLLEKVVKLFKFSSNFKAAEKNRIIDIFGSLGIEDSIKLSEAKIKLLILQLSKRENQHYDTLLKLISNLKNNSPGVSAKQEEAIEEDQLSDNVAVKDKDVDDLTSKILSIVTKKATETEEDKKKNEKLSEIRKVNARRDNVEFIIDSARNIVRRFVVRSFNKVKVLGFYNINQKIKPDELNLSNYNNIIYNGIFVDNKTGHLKNINGWDTAEILTLLDIKNTGLQKFERKKVKPILNIIFSKKSDLSSFVLNNTNQQNLFNDLKYLLPLHTSTEGICLQLNEVDIFYKKQTTEFIIKLSQELKKINKNYNLYVIIPPAGNNSYFEFNLINTYVDYFIIDFYNIPQNPTPTPLAPIKGKELSSIESTISFYINIQIPSSKIILGLSYQGLKWSFNKQSQQFKYLQPLTYAEIRSKYSWPIIYNNEFATAYMDSLDAKGDLKRRIYFEDENTLSKKYDYILQNDLAGVSVYASNFDKGYGELNDMLTYKLSIIDTLFLEDSVIKRKLNPGFFEKLGMRLRLYYYVLNHPCMVCFDNIQDPEERAEIFNSVSGLNWDKEAEKNKQSRFLYVTNHLFRGATQICIFFIICSVILGVFYYRKINVQGGGGKTIYIWNLISWFFVIYSLVLVLFTSNSKWFSFFGIYNKKDNVVTLNSNGNKPVYIGSHDSILMNSNDTSNSVELANGGKDNNTSQNSLQNANASNTKNQIETNAERTAANDATKNIKNKYLNSTLRIAQNDFFKNKSNKKTTNKSVEQNNENIQIDQKESGIIYSSPMTKKDLVDYINDTYCIDELETNTSGCINIPFRTLIIVIVLAMIIGILFDIFAIRRIAQKNEIP
jgi:spore germination protein YaaH